MHSFFPNRYYLTPEAIAALLKTLSTLSAPGALTRTLLTLNPWIFSFAAYPPLKGHA